MKNWILVFLVLIICIGCKKERKPFLLNILDKELIFYEKDSVFKQKYGDKLTFIQCYTGCDCIKAKYNFPYVSVEDQFGGNVIAMLYFEQNILISINLHLRLHDNVLDDISLESILEIIREDIELSEDFKLDLLLGDESSIIINISANDVSQICKDKSKYDINNWIVVD